MPRVKIACGVHPHNAKDYTDASEAQLRQLLKHEDVTALGEIGLDYHYDFSPREAQIEVFRRQLRIAHEMELPVVLHVREAYEEAYQVMEEEGWPKAGVLLHCYTGDAETLKPWIAKDCYVAFGGAISFASSDAIREACHLVPRDRLLAETDSPYMTPVPMRGMNCEPAHVIFNADYLAKELCCETPDERAELFDALVENAKRLLDDGKITRMEVHPR